MKKSFTNNTKCNFKIFTLASELEGINEETISETHLEIIEKSDGERHGGAAVVEPRHILRQKNTQNRCDNVVHSQCSKRKGDGLRDVEPTQQRDPSEKRPSRRFLEVVPGDVGNRSDDVDQSSWASSSSSSLSLFLHSSNDSRDSPFGSRWRGKGSETLMVMVEE